MMQSDSPPASHAPLEPLSVFPAVTESLHKPGYCGTCQKKPAITRDGRYCRKCLKHVLDRIAPLEPVHCTPGRVIRSRALWNEGDNDWDNAVRAFEGG